MPSVERERARIVRSAGTVRSSATRMIVGLCLLLSISSSVPARAQEGQPPSWKALGGPPGPISHVAISREGADIYAVAVAATQRRDDETQWTSAATTQQSAALYHSGDGGMSWQALTNDLAPGQIGSLFVDDKTGALFVDTSAPGPDATTAASMWRSDDKGSTWRQILFDKHDLEFCDVVRNADSSSLFVGAITLDPTLTGLLYRSDDDGKSWTETEIRLTGDQSTGVLDGLFADPVDPNRLYATISPGRLLTSSDMGVTWSVIHQWPEAAVTDLRGVMPLAIRRDSGALFVASTTPEGMVFETSIDMGAHWTALTGNGLPASSAPRTLSALSNGVLLLNSDRGSYRSADDGKNWQPLEGSISSGSVASFLPVPYSTTTVLAATGSGLFVSRDAGGLWQALNSGLPANSSVLGLLTDPRSEGSVIAILDGLEASSVRPPLVMRSRDGGESWTPAARGVPDLSPTCWALDPNSPDTMLIASEGHFLRSTDYGLSWQITAIPRGNHSAIAISPADTATIYLGGRPALRSTDAGRTWSEFPVLLPGQDQQSTDVIGLVIDPAQPQHLWAALDMGGVVETNDGGQHWQSIGLGSSALRFLSSTYRAEVTLIAGVVAGGLYRWSANDATWQAISEGLPPGSSILAMTTDPRDDRVLWASRDGGGIYRSTDLGDHWQSVGGRLGDNLVQAISADYSHAGSVLIGTASTGVWALRDEADVLPPPESVDARIELVWPHSDPNDKNVELANIGIRLFLPHSLEQPACSWSPNVTVLQSTNTDPLMPVNHTATQRSIDGNPFPFWEFNDIGVRTGADSSDKHYFMVRVEGVETRSSVWAHGTDPRTYFPVQDVPSGLAMGNLEAIDARIEIVWPHDESGAELPASEATFVNVGVSLFKHGTRLSVPVGWQPQGITLYGAWNQEVGRSLSTTVRIERHQSGAIAYPQWQFDNIPVDRALDLSSKLFLWVEVEGVETFPTIWTHGADARTVFPVKDEPILGCLP